MAILSPTAPVVFLDRDGVINRSPGTGYVTQWEAFEFLPGSLEAIRDLTQAGHPLVVVSNQSGVGQGFCTRESLDTITRRMHDAIRDAGGALTGVFYCLHRPDEGCACRKPARGLVDQACREHSMDPARSYLVGDDAKDMLLGHAVGCRTILVLSGRTRAEEVPQWPIIPAQVCRDLREAAAWILAQHPAP